MRIGGGHDPAGGDVTSVGKGQADRDAVGHADARISEVTLVQIPVGPAARHQKSPGKERVADEQQQHRLERAAPLVSTPGRVFAGDGIPG